MMRLEQHNSKTTARLLEAVTSLTQELSEMKLKNKSSPYKHRDISPLNPYVRDRDGNVITIGCLVQFLTQGRISSTRGRIYKISSNGERATARDSFGNSVSRAPHNLRVIAYNG